MKSPVNAVLTLALVLAVAAAVTYAGRSSKATAALEARSDSADIRVSRLVVELAESETRERIMQDSLTASDRRNAHRRMLDRAEAAKVDTLEAIIDGLDSLYIPKPVVLGIVQSLQIRIRIRDEIIAEDSMKIATLLHGYSMAIAQRNKLAEALKEQQALTHKWRTQAQPPFFSLRRIKPIGGCVVGLGGWACGPGLAYTF